jgi:hypothetical protein
MSFITALGSADVLVALAVLVGGGIIELPLEYHFKRLIAHHPFGDWIWDALGASLLRALVIVCFVLVAYPALFGLRDAPAIADLLAQGALRLTNLINVAFVLSLLLPLLPLFRRRVSLVLIAQGLVATAMVFGWYADWLGAVSIGPWPGLAPLVIVCGVAFLVHLIVLPIGQTLGQHLDGICGTQGFADIVPHAVALVAQGPTILIYGYALGQQLAA